MYNIQDVEAGLAVILCCNCHMHFHQFFGGRQAEFPEQDIDGVIKAIQMNKDKVYP